MPDATTTTLVATFSTPSPLLRKVLTVDAIVTGLAGLVMAFAAIPLSTRYGLPVGLLRWAGLICMPFAIFDAWLATRSRVHRPAVFFVVACNTLWALDSIVLLLSGWIEPTMLGTVFVVAQAVSTAVFAELEFVGLRRSTMVEAYARR